MLSGFTKCKHCLKAVRVAKGKLCYHIKTTWSNKACPGFKTEAAWIDTHSLNAHGRNSQGFCMACEGHISDGANPDCQQCCYEKRHAN